MSRKGDCYDNAPIESFFHTLKTEPVHHRQYANTEGGNT
jgi:putative transposase